ncbi:MAG: hypothetical protein AMXMBFR33_69330 [Candidatus Xenobia bacterium]|jgi:hypothetical protein
MAVTTEAGLELPKGNPLIEDIALQHHDVSEMLNNLEQDEFTGYVKFEAAGSLRGYFFFNHGTIFRAVEMERADATPIVRMVPRLMNRTKSYHEVSTSSYVMSPRLVNVLGSMFAFKPLFIDYEVKRKELKKVLGKIEQDEYSGIMRVQLPDEAVFLLMERGTPVIDQFAKRYGDVLCGTEAVSNLLDYIHKNGSTIQVHVEKAGEIEYRVKRIEEDLDKIKQLIVKNDAGFLRAQDIVKVAEEIVRDWGYDLKSTFTVEMETSTGQIFEYKCQSGKKLAGYVGLHTNMMKSMGLNEGDVVNIRPLSAS